MPFIDTPLEIGASDLLRGVEFTYCADIFVLCPHFIRKKCWKQRYVIISQGCLYIYTDRKAKKPEQSYSFKEFQSARESDPINGENICFCLCYKAAQAPISFSCDTSENRMKWIQYFNSAIIDVGGNYLSADSGFGSAETVPNNRQRPYGETEDLGYDEVDNRQFQSTKVVDEATKAPRVPVQSYDDGGFYEEPVSAPNNNLYINNSATEDQEDYKGYRKTAKREKTKQEMHNPPSDLMNELKLHVKDKQTKLPMHPPAQTRDRPKPPPKPTTHRSTVHSHDSLISSKHSSSRFCSVRGGGSSLPVQESFSKLSLNGAENLYENNESDSSGDSDNTSPKVIYENPETLIKKFRWDDYFCEDKGVGKRQLRRKADGYFAVFPADESSEYALCVKTPEGLKYFRIYSQDDRVSLYKQHKMDIFTSIDELLTFYSINNLPSEEYSVKLQNGYKSV